MAVGVTRRQLGAVVAAGLGLRAGLTAAGRQPAYPDGLLIADGDDFVELAAYASLKPSGLLAMSFGTVDEIPVVDRVPMLVCNLGMWYVAGVWCTTRRVFDDGRAERRRLTFALNRVNIRTTRLRIAALDEPRRLRALRGDLDAGPDHPMYAVFNVTNGSIVRYYLAAIRLDADEAVGVSRG